MSKNIFNNPVNPVKEKSESFPTGFRRIDPSSRRPDSGGYKENLGDAEFSSAPHPVKKG